MTKISLKTFKQIDDIPSPPTQVIKVLDEVDRTPFKDFDIINIIQGDPGIACRILKIANTPLYGYPGQILSMQQAATLLGPGTIKNIILTTPILEPLGESNGVTRFDTKILWKHMSITATIASNLGSRFTGIEPGVFYVAGLIHDIGKIALLIFYPRIFSECFNLSQQKGITLNQASQELFGWTLAEVSATLAETWNFPTPLVSALKLFPQTLTNNGIKDTLPRVLCLANCLANEWDFGDGMDLIPKSKQYSLAKDLGLTEGMLKELRPKRTELSL